MFQILSQHESEMYSNKYVGPRRGHRPLLTHATRRDLHIILTDRMPNISFGFVQMILQGVSLALRESTF
jgi:hypothetical protein